MAEGITLQEIDEETVTELVISSELGQLADLRTSAKSNIVNAINELFIDVSDGKNAIAAAITGKGVPTSGSDTFSQLARSIGQIPTQHAMAPGEILLYYNPDKSFMVQYTTYTKIFSINVGMTGVFRIRFKIMSANSSQTAFGRIYKNGIAFGTEQSTRNYQSVTTYSEDLPFAAGDKIELWMKTTGSQGYATIFMPEIYGDVPQYIYPD
ncbi:hypothetical protein D3C74_327620 [compost metagenome]